MGAKGTKAPKKAVLSSKDYSFLTKQTGQSKDQIKAIFDQFSANNPDGKLDKAEFVRLYDQLKPESIEALDEIALYVFGAFDTDNSGSITFNEFMLAYAMTSRGDQRQKLEYTFALYDTDDNGYLDNNEIVQVLKGMLDMLGADKKNTDSRALAAECLKDLDKSHDGKINKDEFINGLMANYSLRALMSPFN